MQRFRRNFWALLCLTNATMRSQKLILGWFVGVIFGQEIPNLNDPYI